MIIAVLSSCWGCTEIRDFGPDGAGWGDVAGPDADPCDPDPCAPANRACIAGDCGPCLVGYVEDDGICVPVETDPCTPDPCLAENKVCYGGFCGECQEGYITTDDGTCLEPNACYPNPCTQPLKTVCLVALDGSPTCVCDANTHDDGDGGCTFEPCVPDPCADEEALTHCSWSQATGPLGVCGCPPGSLVNDEGGCSPDPCEPNPCSEFARSVCSVDTENEENDYLCECVSGFELVSGACIEQPVVNTLAQPPADGDVVIDDSLQLFVDDHLVQLNNGLSRRLHAAKLESSSWVVAPELEVQIGRARANGSLVQPPEAFRETLPEDHPLRDKPYWLYYMGYRQLFTADAQPSWLCIAAAYDPAGPWHKEVLVTELQEDGVTEVVNPGYNCVLRIDGMEAAEVTFMNDISPALSEIYPAGFLMLSVTRIALGSVDEAGLYVMTSNDGVNFEFEGGAEEALVLLSDDVFPPSTYTRIEKRSRILWDEHAERVLVLAALGSDSDGDARGIMDGGPAEAVSLPKQPNALEARAVMGPTAEDLAKGYVYGDMTAFRVGSVWIGLVQKNQSLICPRTSYVSAATSRDGQLWVPLRDSVTQSDVVIANNPIAGTIDASIGTLTGGPPATSGGLWHFFSGGVRDGECADEAPEGGIIRHTLPIGQLSGLGTDSVGTAVIITRPMRMPEGQTGSQLFIHANVTSQLRIQVESLSPIDTVLESVEGVVQPGDHQGSQVQIAPLNTLTADRFRLRFTLIGAGEIFGFRMDDPLCDPNPCDQPGKGTCDSSTGVALCVCDPPSHDDGLGGCTEDPCLPDPCTGPHELGCTADGDTAICGCEDGWIKSSGACVKDPCEPADGQVPCAPPGPDKCRVVEGQVECYCPEGSEAGNLGCTETDARVFMSSLSMSIGDVIGVSGADDVCNSLAAAHDLPGEYVAWVSAPGEEAATRLAAGYDGTWRTWDPEVGLWTALVAENIADLTDGQIGASLGWTEKGQPAAETCLVWTGTNTSGDAASPDSGDVSGTCGAWTENQPSSLGLAGRCNATDHQWTAWGPVPCSQSLPVYCFQLADPPKPDPEEPPEGCGDGSCDASETAETCAADCDAASSCKDKCGQFEAEWPCSCLDTCADAGDCCADVLWWCESEGK